MSAPKYKQVLISIRVPAGKWCWEPMPPFAICPHFDNEGGPPRCTISHLFGHVDLEYDKSDGVLKPANCLKLTEV